MDRKKLEDVISVDDTIEIKKMKSMPMIDFETNIWAKYGRANCKSSDRVMVCNNLIIIYSIILILLKE